MDDFDKYIEMFKKYGLGFGVEENGKNKFITLKAKEHAKVAGYAGFFVEFCFSTDGEFQEVGVWE